MTGPGDVLDPMRGEVFDLCVLLAETANKVEAFAPCLQDDQVTTCAECDRSRYVNWPEHQAAELLGSAIDRIRKARKLLVGQRKLMFGL